MRCIECEEIELARVRDQRPGQTLPIPYAALDGFPAGRTPARPDAPPAAAVGRRRLRRRSTAPRSSASSRSGSRSPRPPSAPTDKCLVLLYLAGGNDGLNVILPNERPADYAAYADGAAVHPPRRRAHAEGVDGNPTGRIGSHAAARARRRGARVRQRHGLQDGGGDNWAKRFNFTGTGDFGFDTLYGDGTGGAGSDLAVMPAVDAKQYTLSHFDNSDIWFEASNDLNIKTGWLGRWIDRNGSDDEPAAGDLDRHARCRRRSARRRSPVCAIPSLPMGGFTMNSSNYGGGRAATRRSTPQVRHARRRRRGAPATPTSRARARPTASRSRPSSARQGAGDRRRPTRCTRTRATLSHAAADRRAPAAANLGTRIITIHWGGFDTHTSQLAGQDSQLTELSRALGAFQADLDRARHRAARRDARVLRVRPPREGERRPATRRRHRPRRRRPDDGDGQRRPRRLRGRLARLRARRARARPTTQPGQPEGPDGLPLGLQGRDRGVARRRRPGGRDRRPARSRRWSAATG